VAPVQAEARRPRPWLRALGALALLAILALAAVLGWLKLHEAELEFRSADSRSRVFGQVPADAERLSLHAVDGTALAALILRPQPANDGAYWVLHLHGNGDSAFSSSTLRHCEDLRDLGMNVLSFDYRGFGLSPGIASESHMDEDAETAYQELIRRGVPWRRIIVWGHSLGSGPAVQLAAAHRVAALVLFGAFTSIPDAASDTYPYLPVRWLVSVRFDSLRRIGDVHSPVLIVHSAADTLIPYHHGLQLFAAAHQPKLLLTLPGPYRDGFGGHVDGVHDHLQLLVPALSSLLGGQPARCLGCDARPPQ
jgi:alpha-beta hydrolase superfamily lysophospholipase